MTYLLSALRTLLIALALLLFASPAGAEEAEAILLLVHGDDLPKERLRDAIAAELHKPVTLDPSAGVGGGVVTVTYRAAARELAVTWDGPKRGTVSRVVSAPDTIAEVVRDASMLTGNLARDEAEELLGPRPPLPAVLPPLPPAPAPAATPPERDRPSLPPRDPDDRDYVVGVIHPLATNFDRPYARTRVDLNLFSSRIGQLDGFQLGGVNIVARSADDQKLRTYGDVSGFQIGSIANLAQGHVTGIQIGGLANMAGLGMSGGQFAALINRADTLDGVQLAGLVNTVGGSVHGGQLAALNLAGDVDGAQIGIVNVGGHVRGAAIGLVNVADEIEGVPLGLASVTRTGGIHPRAWTSNETFANVGVKLATRHTYTMPSGHYHRAYDRDFFGAGFTIGGHFPFSENAKGAYLDTELSFAWLYAPERSLSPASNTYHQHLLQPRLRGIVGWRFTEHFSVLAGAGLLTQARITDEASAVRIRIGPEFVVGVEL